MTLEEHSPENHIFYHTYHFSEDLETITEEEVQQKVFEVICNVRLERCVNRSSLK